MTPEGWYTFKVLVGVAVWILVVGWTLIRKSDE